MSDGTTIAAGRLARIGKAAIKLLKQRLGTSHVDWHTKSKHWLHDTDGEGGHDYHAMFIARGVPARGSHADIAYEVHDLIAQALNGDAVTLRPEAQGGGHVFVGMSALKSLAL